MASTSQKLHGLEWGEGGGFLRYISDGGGAKTFFGFDIKGLGTFIELENFPADVFWE